jgi:hypothetical protein
VIVAPQRTQWTIGKLVYAKMLESGSLPDTTLIRVRAVSILPCHHIVSIGVYPNSARALRRANDTWHSYNIATKIAQTRCQGLH